MHLRRTSRNGSKNTLRTQIHLRRTNRNECSYMLVLDLQYQNQDYFPKLCGYILKPQSVYKLRCSLYVYNYWMKLSRALLSDDSPSDSGVYQSIRNFREYPTRMLCRNISSGELSNHLEPFSQCYCQGMKVNCFSVSFSFYE